MEPWMVWILGGLGVGLGVGIYNELRAIRVGLEIDRARRERISLSETD